MSGAEPENRGLVFRRITVRGWIETYDTEHWLTKQVEVGNMPGDVEYLGKNIVAPLCHSNGRDFFKFGQK